MFSGARIGSQRLRPFNQNLVSIRSKRVQSLGDELIQRHCLLGFLAVHEFCTHPRRHELEYSRFSERIAIKFLKLGRRFSTNWGVDA